MHRVMLKIQCRREEKSKVRLVYFRSVLLPTSRTSAAPNHLYSPFLHPPISLLTNTLRFWRVLIISHFETCWFCRILLDGQQALSEAGLRIVTRLNFLRFAMLGFHALIVTASARFFVPALYPASERATDVRLLPRVMPLVRSIPVYRRAVPVNR